MVCKKCGYQNSQGASFCAGCGKKLSEPNNKTNNKMMIYTGAAIIVLSCLLCVSVVGRKEKHVEHQWLPANCVTPKTCSVCGATEGNALSHNWIDATCTQAKMCSVCFRKTGSPLGHTWPGNDHTKRMYCTVCGESNGVTEVPIQNTVTPSEEDLVPFGPVIAYPHPSSYLSDYETRYVKAPKGHSIYVYWNPDDASSRRKFLLYEGDEVTVLARQGSLSCVIFTDQSGEQQVGWASSDCLYYEY